MAKARASLGKLCEGTTRASDSHEGAEAFVYQNIALTWQGLQRLGVPDAELSKFPLEFQEGMEDRAGLLGDVRTNHPRNWALPRRNWPPPGSPDPIAERIQVSSVDLVVQLRATGERVENWLDVDGNPLRTALQVWAACEGLELLGVEPMVRYENDKGKFQDHFGFTDGISQPTLEPKPERRNWHDTVAPGEIIIGYENDRGDPAYPAELGEQDLGSEWLRNGTFLVVRKPAPGRRFPEPVPRHERAQAGRRNLGRGAHRRAEGEDDGAHHRREAPGPRRGERAGPQRLHLRARSTGRPMARSRLISVWRIHATRASAARIGSPPASCAGACPTAPGWTRQTRTRSAA